LGISNNARTHGHGHNVVSGSAVGAIGVGGNVSGETEVMKELNEVRLLIFIYVILH
jgi:hypothetical protein